MTSENVIDINELLAVRELADLLELSQPQAVVFFSSLKNGNSLAKALREIGVTSVSQIGLDIWPDLRSWRDRNFPLSKKIS